VGAFTKRVSGGVAWLELNVAAESVNKITRAVRGEFREHLESLCVDEEIQAAILISRKTDHFIAGADVDEFAGLRTRAEAIDLVRDGQALVNRLETIGKPIVAAIHGACVGGGLEAALACTYRIVTKHPKTVLSLPEIRLGIIPAAGGCQRLPRLIGLRNALDMILTGRSLSAQQAFQKGLADELVHPSILDSAALKAARRLVTGWRPKRQRGGIARLATDRNQLARKTIFAKARKTMLAKTGGHYPAPLAALDAVRHGLQYGLDAGLEHEAAHFSELAIGDVSRTLVQLFFAGTALKKDYGSATSSLPQQQISNIAIVGSGLMGAAIAGVAVASAAVDVRLRDKDLNRVVKGLDGARDVVRNQRLESRIDGLEQRRLELLLSGGVDWAGFGRADLVIEAVSEDPDVKCRVVADVESHVGSECIIASNSSTIPISQLAKSALQPQRIIGMHFFSPVTKTPLVEVVAHQQTASWVVSMVASFGRAMNKTVIVVKDSPGFWVNRILAPYLHETWMLLEEGVDAEALDSEMTEFGFPVGPVTLLDEVGLDVVHELLQALSTVFGERMKPKEGLVRMVDEGRLGRKAGRGLFRYRRGKKRRVDDSAYELIGTMAAAPSPAGENARRLVYSMLNEAARALEEGVVDSPRDGDIGAVYGTGFPPFRGGPLRHMDHIGTASVFATLVELEERHGDRFTPAQSIAQMAERNEKFYTPFINGTMKSYAP
jgi:3-hydroxyacyl-CoA dehydrogenase/enoyl-CoA hydratase/3-hydroxybutyryl-CoA epimerase